MCVGRGGFIIALVSNQKTAELSVVASTLFRNSHYSEFTLAVEWVVADCTGLERMLILLIPSQSKTLKKKKCLLRCLACRYIPFSMQRAIGETGTEKYS